MTPMENVEIGYEESKRKIFGEDYDRIVKAKEVFGWTIVKGGAKKKPKAYKTYKVTFQRNKNIPYHDRLDELEKFYFEKEDDRKYYYSGDILNYILLYLLLVIPGVIYTLVKKNARKKVQKNNEAIDKAQKTYLNEAASIREAAYTRNALEDQAEIKKIPNSYANKPVETREVPVEKDVAAPELASDSASSSTMISSTPSSAKEEKAEIEAPSFEKAQEPVKPTPAVPDENDDEDEEEVENVTDDFFK